MPRSSARSSPTRSVRSRARRVLERVQGRLSEMRELESELAAEAEEDGTIGDVDTGYEEGEAEPREQVRGQGVQIR